MALVLMDSSIASSRLKPQVLRQERLKLIESQRAVRSHSIVWSLTMLEKLFSVECVEPRQSGKYNK